MLKERRGSRHFWSMCVFVLARFRPADACDEGMLTCTSCHACTRLYYSCACTCLRRDRGAFNEHIYCAHPCMITAYFVHAYLGCIQVHNVILELAQRNHDRRKCLKLSVVSRVVHMIRTSIHSTLAPMPGRVVSSMYTRHTVVGAVEA